ncbi:MAG: type IX secretion system sortase PorU [Rhodothermales bacterium]
MKWTAHIGLLVFLAFNVWHVEAQAVRWSEGPEPGMFVFEADWSQPLQAALDSAGIQVLDDDAVWQLSEGAFSASHLVYVAPGATPRVEVVRAAYDEVVLPAGQLTLPMSQPTAVVGLGMYRKQRVGTLVWRAVQYDATSQRVRRYRRAVVRVSGLATKDARQRQVASAKAFNDNPHLAVTESALARGTVFKLPVVDEGMYRIDRAFLAALPGMNPDAVDPARVQVFGNGGTPLPALNSADRYGDIAENPVIVQGGGDGSFGENDAVWFYGASTQNWTYNADQSRWDHIKHPIADTNYYFIRIGEAVAKTVETAPFPNWTDAPTQATAPGRFVLDLDEFLWSREHGSGHTWVSQVLNSTQRSRNLFSGQALPGFDGGTADYRIRVGIQSNPRSQLNFTSGGVRLHEERAERLINSLDIDEPIASTSIAEFQQVVSGTTINLTAELPIGAGSPQAAIDWAQVLYTQQLRAESGVLRFVFPPDADRVTFDLTGFSALPTVLDITEPDAIRALEVQAQGATYRVQDARGDGAPREYIAFVSSSVQSASAALARPVEAQNLHGIQAYPDLVIVAPQPFLTYAEQLAERRRAQGLEVLVSRFDQIINEFSGGVPDVRAVRDYFKFLYDRAPDESRALQFGLLFGDGHYDIRGINARNNENYEGLSNWIYPYQTIESFDPVSSYTSDDYFGLLDDNEGVWRWTGLSGESFERMDIGIGRLPIQTAGDAEAILNKIERYESVETFGAWRTNYIFSADDAFTGLNGDKNENDLHLRDANVVAELVKSRFSDINVEKIFATSYPRVFQNGFRIPGARKAILDALEEGALFFNYSGHGGPDGLAQEEVFSVEDVRQLRNLDKLSIFVTATCSFGWWDLDDHQSGAEELLLNPDGGGIAAFTTVRIAYTSGNSNSLNPGLNRAMSEALLSRAADGLPRRLGTAMVVAKNTGVGLQGNSRKFNLIGDPSMRLGLPAGGVTITEVGGADVRTETAPVRALDRLTIRGQVLQPDGQPNSGFSGAVQVTMWDAERQVAIPDPQYLRSRPYYLVREDLIWSGEVTAQNGTFEATFVVPKDISYSNELGRISAYAKSADTDAIGYTENIRVGGTAASGLNDAAGPEIRLFLNDTTYVSGSLTHDEPELIVQLFDESGINTVGAGVGHEILLIVNGDEERAVDIGNRYQSAENSYQRGTIRWPLGKQEAGLNALTVRAWDVVNNSTTAELTYTVTANEAVEIRNLLNYPNPTPGPTRFVFEHNQRPGTPADIEVRVYTLSGRMVRVMETDEALPMGVLPGGLVQIPWDGLDNDLDPLGSGVYLYKVRVATDDDDGTRHITEHLGKLAVIR